jgi:hypothetical protein
MNATYLFQQPFREFHHSESWWSAFFSLFLLDEAQAPTPRRLPVWRYLHRDRYWRSGEFDVAGLHFSNVVVEGSLCARPFDCLSLPQEYRALKVDLVLIRDRRVTLIETKTIGASIANNLLRYVALTDYLRSQGFEADLYHLLSYGHETRNDWRLISQHKVPFIFWEDVFWLASSTRWSHTLGIDLNQYTERPVDAGGPGQPD